MDNARVSINSPVGISTVVKVSCFKNGGYFLLGEEEVTCDSNAEWSKQPMCLTSGK